ncbi:hypothetical protein ACJJTC_007224 [Scirpophaga incertulas]
MTRTYSPSHCRQTSPAFPKRQAAKRPQMEEDETENARESNEATNRGHKTIQPIKLKGNSKEDGVRLVIGGTEGAKFTTAPPITMIGGAVVWCWQHCQRLNLVSARCGVACMRFGARDSAIGGHFSSFHCVPCALSVTVCVNILIISLSHLTCINNRIIMSKPLEMVAARGQLKATIT